MDERDAIREAIEILDECKRAVVHHDLDAWFILCHAKFYLQAQIGEIL